MKATESFSMDEAKMLDEEQGQEETDQGYTYYDYDQYYCNGGDVG